MPKLDNSDPQIRGVSGINLGHLTIVSISALILISPFLFLCYVKGFNVLPMCWVGDCPDGTTDTKRNLFVLIFWSAAFSLACASGCLGTIMSFFLRQTSQEPINTGKAASGGVQAYIGLREIFLLEFFGAVFGMLMLGLFVGGFVQGSLFPHIIDDNSRWMEISIKTNSWAKIMIWCFIAGFSERLIPNLLDGLVRKVEPATPNGPPTAVGGLSPDAQVVVTPPNPATPLP